LRKQTKTRRGGLGVRSYPDKDHRDAKNAESRIRKRTVHHRGHREEILRAESRI
jgi:hypothetical protein